ncbi:MucB/RseB C-terminal domain-containing protein [Billgrantia gudaonensis]|uniref:Sigma E regulatory protein, MucB/RseB n=1 Tax=Billgrantia gudaonensis TaxID=376427 RepID=A0A1G8NF14_9GAMM|nr:MucB/RseB C-terminal domain-containing protein [Halomonas gudaonensis]SDI78667.1 sigma E regulatory protein, MucB/RseB [Halomonas gudaonensis]
MRVGRTAWRLALLGGLIWVSAGVLASEEEGEADSFDCAQVAEWDAPDSPMEWFERSLWANHCYVFQARAVRISVDGVRTVALSHDVQDGVEREVARFLDGPPMIFERRGRIGRLTWTEDGSEAPASPTGIARHLERFYRLSLGEEERIASRRVVRLDVEPLDDHRYGHRFWLDRDTALPLKQQLLNEEGRVVETFQFTELQRPQLHEGDVIMDRRRSPPSLAWRPGWLPKGFIAQPVVTRSQRHGERVGHRIYSDGLSTLSLFVEPLDEAGKRLMPGLHRLGISMAVVRHIERAGQPHQVVVMGELPVRVLVRVSEGLIWEESERTE